MSLVCKVIDSNTQDLLKRTHLPVILIGHAGNVLTISGAIFTDTVYVDTLLTMKLLLGHSQTRRSFISLASRPLWPPQRQDRANTTRTYQTITTSLSILSSLILLPSRVFSRHSDTPVNSTNIRAKFKTHFTRNFVPAPFSLLGKLQDDQMRKSAMRLTASNIGQIYPPHPQ